MKQIISFLVIYLVVGLYLPGYPKDGKNEKVFSKNSEIIDNAAPDDWHTLASCAEACIKKNIINKEVADWIDRSLKIRKTAYNLEVKGDYYIKNKLPNKAGECYLEAIQVGIDEDINFDYSGLQEKIAKIVNLDT